MNYKFDEPKRVNITRMADPPHVGELIKDEFNERGLTLDAAARAIKTPRPFLSDMLNGKRRISTEMALRLEKAFGLDADLVLRMYHSWEAAQLRRDPPESLKAIQPVARAA